MEALLYNRPVLAVQWAGSLFRELDYTKEAANGVRFRELYSRLEVRILMHVLCRTS